MGTTKITAHTIEQNQLAKIFKALAHPARIAILQYISEQPNCICNDLVNEMDLAQATISQHLVELKKAGLIKGEITGKKLCYCIDVDKWYETKQLINTFFIETQKKSC